MQSRALETGPDAGLQRRTDEALRQVALGISGVRGAEIFPALVRYIGSVLGVDYAFIALPTADDSERMRTLAMYAHGAMAEPMEYDLRGSPCESVLGQQFRFIAREVARLYPGDSMLHEIGIEGYAAVPLFDSLGRSMGLMAVMHGQPLTDPILVESMLRILSVRAAAELERAQVEEARKHSEESYRAIFQASEDSVFIHDWDTGAILDVNPKACQTYGYTREEFRGIDVGVISAGMHPYTREEAGKLIERAKQGEIVRTEWHRRNKDGTLRWDEVYLRAANIAGDRRILAFTRDITERKQSEEQLRASEEQYRTIFNASVDGMVLWTMDGHIVDANPAFCRMNGCTREELIASQPFEFIPVEGRAHCRAFFDSMRKSLPQSTQSKGMRKDGTTFNAEVHAVPVLHQGKPHLLAIVRDVTERKEREEALARSESQLRATIEAALDCVIAMNAEGNITEFNHAAEQCFGWRREQVLGRPLEDVIIPLRYRESHRERMHRYRTTGENPFPRRRMETEAMRADGSVFPIELAISAARAGGTELFIGYLRDIAEQKRAEAQLRQSEERYRLLFEMESDAIVLVDVETLQHLDVNRAAVELYGYSREELLALRATDLSAEPQKTRTAMKNGSGFIRVPLRYHRKKDGTVFPIEITANFFELHGRKIMLAAMRDITEQKRAEAERTRLEGQLRQAQKMEAIGHLSGGIAHDFNNILTTVMGYVAMAQERLGGKADERLARYLERALRSARQARDLIQQLLTFSRGQRGTPRPLHLGPLVKESSKLLRSMLPSSIALSTECPDELPAVMLDPVQLEQILMNLCLNARDAMEEAGQLRIVLRRASCESAVCSSCRKPVNGAFVELAVADSGGGIPASIVDRMFEPFFTTKEPGKGSGMGLSMVHGIVHEHGGHILVESVRGEGATFRVLFPVADVQPKEEAAVADAPASPRARRLRGRVLVVDDEPAVGEFMGELLADWGLDVTVEQSSSAAQALFAREPQRFDLVVTDQTMPPPTGLELARAMLNVRADLPIVLYTGYAERLTEQQTRASGIRAFVTKPVDIDAFFELLRDLLGGESAKN